MLVFGGKAGKGRVGVEIACDFTFLSNSISVGSNPEPSNQQASA